MGTDINRPSSSEVRAETEAWKPAPPTGADSEVVIETGGSCLLSSDVPAPCSLGKFGEPLTARQLLAAFGWLEEDENEEWVQARMARETVCWISPPPSGCCREEELRLGFRNNRVVLCPRL